MTGGPGPLLDAVNTLYHLPVFSDYLCYGHWALLTVLGPVIGVITILLDHFTGHIWTLIRLNPSSDKVVFITGCDSGFGRAAAIRAAQKGFKVYAACLTEKGGEELKKEAKEGALLLTVVKLDVTKVDEVQAVAERVAAENPQGLFALINNAGVAKNGLFDWMDVSDYRFIMEVNFFGTLNVTKAFLPQVKASKGRIINMSSITGVSCGVVMSSAYASSKHALEVFTSALRCELKPFGVDVVTITPGFHRTELHGNAVSSLRALWSSLPSDKRAEYGEGYGKACEPFLQHYVEDYAWDPRHVTDTVELSLVSKWPRAVYAVGLDAKLFVPLMAILPKRVVEPMLYYTATNAAMRTVPPQHPSRGGDKAAADANQA